MNEAELIQACRQGRRPAQRRLYEQYAPLMLGVIRRYISRQDEAEDVLLEGFYKVFDKLGSYKGKGSFEGWMRRIMVNEALMKLRKKHALRQSLDLADVSPENFSQAAGAEGKLAADDIMQLLDRLAPGHRTVFNLYVIEGYKHREIADILEISINTSKSQLIAAKQKLRFMLIELGYSADQL